MVITSIIWARDMPTSGAKVYSYTRFSDPRQASGNSADRQAQYARAWAAERGLMLDESLSLRDEGLSAFHQQHIKQGALGAFLVAVEEGRIASGSYLVVEGLDRLSRAEPIQAQAQLAQIINAGITVVTASDGREYNRERLKAQPMDLVYSLLVMIRAHEESDTKSKRVKAAIRRQCQGWIEGTYRGPIRNGSDPQWVQWDGEQFVLIPQRVEAVLYALELYRNGLGAKRALVMLQQRDYNLAEWGLSGQQLYRLVKLVALKGAKRISIDEQDYLLEGYYPRLMSDAEFDELQHLAGQRYRRRGKGALPGLITGIGISFCGYCGTAIGAQNQMAKVRADGTLLDGNRRIMCSAYSAKQCSEGGSISVAPLERALMGLCSDQVNLQRLQEPAIQGQDLRPRVLEARKKVEELDRQLNRVTEALMAGESDGAAPFVFVRKARELEGQLQSAREVLQKAERDLAGVASRQTPADANKWVELVSEVDAQNEQAREIARQLVIDTFDRITIYMRGIIPGGRKSRNIDVVLKSRAGQIRTLRIDRKTGVWLVSEFKAD